MSIALVCKSTCADAHPSFPHFSGLGQGGSLDAESRLNAHRLRLIISPVSLCGFPGFSPSTDYIVLMQGRCLLPLLRNRCCGSCIQVWHAPWLSATSNCVNHNRSANGLTGRRVHYNHPPGQRGFAASNPEKLVLDHTPPEDWDPIYRLKPMPFIQALSRLKFLITGVLVLGTPPALYAAHNDYVSHGFMYLFLGSTAFSLCTLAAYSFFTTRLVGVMSVHRPTGLIRIGSLTFWGGRANTLIHLDSLIPPTDLCDTPETNQTVRVGILDDKGIPNKSSPVKKLFFLTRLKAEIVNPEEFSKILGFLW
ncbi:unnamed protein product [Calicophoron daubneyi]|uniref:Transmembrane protein 186 n=1 Tax=Calicophoron daubneyi TaxID=300641 RepID=A0AAV2THQ9_CALDB